jgi:hypothetical protein
VRPPLPLCLIGRRLPNECKTYYELFSIDVAPFDSVEQVVLEVANNTTVFQRFLIVSHAHPRRRLIPFFTNGVKKANKEIFREVAKGNLHGLKRLSPFPGFDSAPLQLGFDYQPTDKRNARCRWTKVTVDLTIP